jgi:hypothetical protein
VLLRMDGYPTVGRLLAWNAEQRRNLTVPHRGIKRGDTFHNRPVGLGQRLPGRIILSRLNHGDLSTLCQTGLINGIVKSTNLKNILGRVPHVVSDI